MVTNFKTVSDIAKKYADDVKKVMPVDKVILFGSHAKGTADEQSDIDICFFLPSFGTKRKMDIIYELLKISDMLYKDIYFEPIAFPTSEIDRENPFVKEVLRTGIEL